MQSREKTTTASVFCTQSFCVVNALTGLTILADEDPDTRTSEKLIEASPENSPCPAVQANPQQPRECVSAADLPSPLASAGKRSNQIAVCRTLHHFSICVCMMEWCWQLMSNQICGFRLCSNN